MTFSSVCRAILHLYFNHYQVESSSLYLHSAFTRRLQFAFRVVVAFLVGGFLGYASPLYSSLSLVFLIPSLGVLSIQETFGLTLLNTFDIILVLVPLSIFLFIAQKIGLSYENYLAGELIFLLSSFCISYRCPKMKTRKLVLWFNVLFFVTIINTPTVRLTFVFELLADFLLGMTVALLVSLLIFPLFATCDIENRTNYCLLHLDQMQTFVLQAFLWRDQTAAKVSLARAAIVERRVRKAGNLMKERLDEARSEPSRCLQWLFDGRRKHIILLTVDQQEELVTKLMIHVCSVQAMVQQCAFNQYHTDLIDALQGQFSELLSCQSSVVSGLIAPSAITREQFIDRFTNLQTALDSLNVGYHQFRLRRIKQIIRTGIKPSSEEHLSYTFLFFQLNAIVRLLKHASVIYFSEEKSKVTKKKKSLKDFFHFQLDWSRILSAMKSVLILGVGSVFVVIPQLANSFANGQWVLVALCMTQGETVGGAFNTMRMRFVGTLLGCMWAYATYVVVGATTYKIFGMIVPWLLVFSYLKLVRQWDYTATVAASTPIGVNLGRLYGDVFRQSNYVLLRIQETIIGIALGVVLTIVIFPVFAVDVLKVNIQKTLKTCLKATESIHSIYDRFFQHKHAQQVSLIIDQEQDIKSIIDLLRQEFYKLIGAQQTLLDGASQEPSIWWFNYGFSPDRYDTLIQQELDMFRMLHNMHAAIMHVSEYAISDRERIENLRLHAAGGRFLPDLHQEFTDLSKQLSECVDLWTSYLTLTQTTYYRWSRLHVLYRKKKLVKGDLKANQQSLIELHQTILRLQSDHHQALHRLIDYYIEESAQGNELSSFVPYADDDQADAIFVAISAMYYSTIQLAEAALALGTTIHTIFELETTAVYRSF